MSISTALLHILDGVEEMCKDPNVPYNALMDGQKLSTSKVEILKIMIKSSSDLKPEIPRVAVKKPAPEKYVPEEYESARDRSRSASPRREKKHKHHSKHEKKSKKHEESGGEKRQKRAYTSPPWGRSTGFRLFQAEQRDKDLYQGDDFKAFQKKISPVWNNMKEEEKKIYNDRAKEENKDREHLFKTDMEKFTEKYATKPKKVSKPKAPKKRDDSPKRSHADVKKPKKTQPPPKDEDIDPQSLGGAASTDWSPEHSSESEDEEQVKRRSPTPPRSKKSRMNGSIEEEDEDDSASIAPIDP